MAEIVMFDPEDMTIGEMMDVEAITGVDISVTVQKWERTGKVTHEDGTVTTVMPDFSAKELLALLFISARKADPTFTLEDAKATKIKDLSFGPKDAPAESAG